MAARSKRRRLSCENEQQAGFNHGLVGDDVAAHQQQSGVFFPRNSLGSSFSAGVAGMSLGGPEEQCYAGFEFTAPSLVSESTGQLPMEQRSNGMQLHSNNYGGSPVYSSASASSSASSSPSSFSPSHPALLSIATYDSQFYPQVAEQQQQQISPRGRGGLLQNLSPPKLKGFQPSEVLSLQQQQQPAMQAAQFTRRRSVSAGSRSYTAQMLEDNPNEAIFPFTLFEDEEYNDSSSLLAPQMAAWMNVPAGSHQSFPGAIQPAHSGSFSFAPSMQPTAVQQVPPPGYAFRAPSQSGQQQALPMSLPVSVQMQSTSPTRNGYYPGGPVIGSNRAMRPGMITGFKHPQDPTTVHFQPQMYPQQQQTLYSLPEHAYQQELLLQQQQIQQQQQQQAQMQQIQQQQQQAAAAVQTKKTSTRGRKKKEKVESMEDNWKSVIAHTNTNNVQLQRSKWWWYIQSEKLRMTTPTSPTGASTAAAPASTATAPPSTTAPSPVVTAPRGSCGEALGLPTSPNAVVNNKPGDTNKTSNGAATGASGKKKGSKKGEEEAQGQHQKRKLPARSKLHDLIEWVRNLDQAQAEKQEVPQELI